MGFVTGVVDKIVDRVWGAGIRAKCDDERAEKILNDWMRDVNFSMHGRKWVRESLVKGSGFMELSGGMEEVPQEVKVINACSMYIKRDKKGKVLSYTQYVGDSKMYKKESGISFLPYQIAFFPYNQVGDGAYGYGIVYPNTKKIDDFLKSDKDMHTILSRKANSPLVATLGDKEEDLLPSQGEIDGFSDSMTYRNERTEWAVSDLVRLSTIDYGNVGDKFAVPLQHDSDMLFFGFQVPEVLMVS